METSLLVVAGATAIVGARVAWWWFIDRNQPKYPPLEFAVDDPEILLARASAKETLERLRELHAEALHECQVKVEVTTDTGVREHLWSSLISIGDERVRVLYLTPPVSQNGALEREHEHAVSDLSDWAVFRKDGAIEGGYTQRVMFKRAREKWGSLPKELEKQAARYVA